MSEPNPTTDLGAMQRLLARVDDTWLKVVKSRGGPQVVQREALTAHADAMDAVRAWLRAQSARQLAMFDEPSLERCAFCDDYLGDSGVCPREH